MTPAPLITQLLKDGFFNVPSYRLHEGFPVALVVKNPYANAGR